MWSHYADSHRGFCVEYDFAEADISVLPFPVVYSNIRPQVPWGEALTRSPENTAKAASNLMIGLLTKDKCWEYENEWRFLMVASASPSLKMPKISRIYLGALIDDKNRHIMWSWLRDNVRHDFKRFAWSGVYGIPRNVWYQDGELKMAPIAELEQLQYDHISYSESDGENVRVGDGAVCRIKGVWAGNEQAGLAVRVSEDGNEYVEIYYSPEEKKLVMDTKKCGTEGWRVHEAAPFELREGEELSLDILIDKSVIEIYANNRQAICRRAYPTNAENSKGVKLIGEAPIKLDTYQMFPSNPY
jgi:hypothetical protein